MRLLFEDEAANSITPLFNAARDRDAGRAAAAAARRPAKEHLSIMLMSFKVRL